MKTSEVLTAARALIDTPEKWSHQNAYGENGSMCAVVAISRASHASGDVSSGSGTLSDLQAAEAGVATAVATISILSAMHDAIGASDLAVWQDQPERTHTDIMAAFDRAIAAAQADEARS